MRAWIEALKGLGTYVPGLYRPTAGATGGTDSARYCYSVWLRHLVLAHRSGLKGHPKVVAELGPGDSLGIGLAALLSGADRYYALDVVEYATPARNLRILDELADLFRQRQPIPDQAEFPRVRPLLDTYDFPDQILNGDWLEQALDHDRIIAIRNALLHPKDDERQRITIAYCVPWYQARVIREASVDLIFSQAVLEEVDDLALTYQELGRWLRPEGLMSHEIDFSCYGKARQWNGHWAYSDVLWRLIVGKRPFLINREPCSTHLTLLREHGFDVVCALRTKDHSGIGREQLAPRFRGMSDEDLITKNVFLQAVKRDAARSDSTGA